MAGPILLSAALVISGAGLALIKCVVKLRSQYHLHVYSHLHCTNAVIMLVANT